MACWIKERWHKTQRYFSKSNMTVIALHCSFLLLSMFFPFVSVFRLFLFFSVCWFPFLCVNLRAESYLYVTGILLPTDIILNEEESVAKFVKSRVVNRFRRVFVCVTRVTSPRHRREHHITK